MGTAQPLWALRATRFTTRSGNKRPRKVSPRFCPQATAVLRVAMTSTRQLLRRRVWRSAEWPPLHLYDRLGPAWARLFKPSSCNVNPAQIQLSGAGSVTSTVTCNVPAPSSSASTTQVFPWSWLRPASWNTWWTLSVILAILGLVFQLLPMRFRMRRLAYSLLALSVLSFAVGCGGGGDGTGGSGGKTPTTIMLSVASTTVQSGANLMATVQVS